METKLYVQIRCTSGYIMVIILNGIRQYDEKYATLKQNIFPGFADKSLNNRSIWVTQKSDGIDKLYAYDSSHDFITVDDIDIQVNTREKFRHYGATFSVAGSTFNIAIKETKNSLKFAIENQRHMASDVEGLLGFTMAQSYQVKYSLYNIVPFIDTY